MPCSCPDLLEVSVQSLSANPEWRDWGCALYFMGPAMFNLDVNLPGLTHSAQMTHKQSQLNDMQSLLFQSCPDRMCPASIRMVALIGLALSSHAFKGLLFKSRSG